MMTHDLYPPKTEQKIPDADKTAKGSSSFLSYIPKTGNIHFDEAIIKTLKHEGVYSNDLNDRGGATKYGISLRTAQRLGASSLKNKKFFDIDNDGDIDIEDIKKLSKSEAIRIYKQFYWDPYPYHKMPTPINQKVFDLAVNMGSKQAHILLQRSLRACHHPAVKEDGIIGPATLRAVLSCDREALLAALKSHAAGFYRVIAAQNPQFNKFLNGWLNRAYA
jgi:lysozyme family protein